MQQLRRIEGGPEPSLRHNGKPNAIAMRATPVEERAVAVAVPTAVRALSDPIGLGVLAGGRPLTLVVSDLIRHAAILGGAGSEKTTLPSTSSNTCWVCDVAAIRVDSKGDLAAFADPSPSLLAVD